MLRQDLSYALRMLRRSPTFAITAILTLALGIGANTAIFTVVHAVLLKPLAYPEPDRLVRITGSATHTRFDAIREAKSYSAVAASNVFTENVALALPEGPEPLRAVRVSHNFLPALGINPAVGRAFLEDEETRGLPVAMMSSELWHRRFSGNPRVLGTSITLAGVPHTIVGVLPAGMQLPFPELDVWRPFDIDNSPIRRNSPILTIIGRLKPSVTTTQANAELLVINRQYAAEHPAALDARPARRNETTTPLKDSLVRNVRSILWMLFGAVAFVLLMACANVASLILARATSRAREFAVRAAIGASRARLVQQQMVESLLLAAIGGTLGVALAWCSLGALGRLPGLELPRTEEIHLDGTVLAFAIAAALLTSVLFGLAPSLSTSKPDLASTLKGTGETWPSRLALWLRPRGLLVVSQVALSMILLIGAALLIESLASLRKVNPGFEPQNLLTMEITLPAARHDELVRRVEAIPGVRAAAVALSLPMTGWAGTPVQRADQPVLKLNERTIAILQTVTPGYFRTLGIALRQGRDFTETDNAAAPLVVIVNQSLVRKFWPNDNPIGRHILIGTNPRPVQITGVVADVHQDGLAEEAGPGIYRPRTQFPLPSAMFAVRTVGDPLQAVKAIRKEIVAIDPHQTITSVRTMSSVIDASEGQRHSIMILLSIFAATGLLLVIVGIYGVMAYSVGQRTREVGIRRALGAQQGDVLWLVVSQGLSLAAAGVIVGIAGAFGLSRLLKGLLFQVSATDPATFAGVTVLLILVSLAATFMPARRAMSVEPTVAIKAQ